MCSENANKNGWGQVGGGGGGKRKLCSRGVSLMCSRSTEVIVWAKP